jgi:hypothetical protein
VVKDVSDGEIVAEGGYDKGNGGENHESENHDSGTTSGFTEALPKRVTWKEERDKADTERIDAQSQCKEQGKTAD